MGHYGRNVLQRHEKVLTASSDIGTYLEGTGVMEQKLTRGP